MKVLGLILITAGILGICVGFWLCFIGGIAGIINAIKAPGPVTTSAIGWNIAKIIFGGLAGYLSFLFFVIPGIALIIKK